MRVDFLLLAIVAIFALAYQITWLFAALGIMLFALVLAEQSSAPKAGGSPVAAGAAAQEKQVIVVQQPQAQPGFFDYFLAQQMHSAVEKEHVEKRHEEVIDALKDENKHLKELVEMEKKKLEKAKKEKKK